MNFGIVTTGFRGDVQPFIALALGLKRRGHDVSIVASENFKDFVTGFGIRFLPITGEPICPGRSTGAICWPSWSTSPLMAN